MVLDRKYVWFLFPYKCVIWKQAHAPRFQLLLVLLQPVLICNKLLLHPRCPNCVPSFA